jgi:hypothetical protein
MSTTASVPSWVRTDSATASADLLVADGLMLVKRWMHRGAAEGSEAPSRVSLSLEPSEFDCEQAMPILRTPRRSGCQCVQFVLDGRGGLDPEHDSDAANLVRGPVVGERTADAGEVLVRSL